MTTPTQHLEIFDEFSHCLHWELDKDKMVIDATPTEIKQHLIQTVISVLEEQIQEVTKIMKYNLESNGRFNACTEMYDSLTTTLSTWRAMLETTP